MEQIPSQLGNVSPTWRDCTCRVIRLSGEIPTELGRLSNLTHLVQDENQLSGIIPLELVNLSNLTWVLLSGNQLTGCIPQGVGRVWRITDFAALGLPFCGDGSPDLIVNRASVERK